MTRSKNFLINRIKEGKYDSKHISIADWEDAEELDFIQYFNVIKNLSMPAETEFLLSSTSSRRVLLEQDGNADFDYCMSELILTDGTYAFEGLALECIFDKLSKASSYYTKTFSVKTFSRNNLVVIKYTVGNLLVGRTIIEPPKASPHLCVLTDVVLPVKFDFLVVDMI